LKKILLLLFCLFHCIIHAQLKITGLVIHKNNGTPISGVRIVDITSGEEIYTDIEGKFSCITSGILEVSLAGYHTQRITYTTNQNSTIQLIPSSITLDEVVINQLSIPLQQKHAVSAVSLVSKENIQRGSSLALHPILNKIPGVFMQNGTLNTNRISIRGIGARNLFGTASIRTYFGDIPLTDGNGESSIEDMELEALSSIEIHKGPSSSSFGVGLGGTILLKPTYILEQSTKSSVSTSFASYGASKVLAKVGLGRKTYNIHIAYSNTDIDSYRDNNQYNRNTVTATAAIQLTDKDHLSILASYIDLTAGIPSSLSEVNFTNNPRQAAFTWGRAKAFEDINYGILGLTWEHIYHPKLSHHTSIFGSYRKNYEPRPFNILDEKSNTFGVRSRILGTTLLLQKEWNWTIGGELFYDFYTGKTFDNLYQDFPIETGSVQGTQLSDLNEKRNYYNLFLETNVKLNDRLRFNLGLHLNRTFFDIKDQFQTGDENNSGKFDFAPILSPKFGLNYLLNSNITIFTNVSHGFSTPTTTETLLPDGEFNPNIKPEIGWNYEVGTRYHLLQKKMFGSLSLYKMNITDLLVSRRTVEDNFFAVNAGKTTHNGIEGVINYIILKKNNTQINLFINSSLHDFKFKDFKDLDDDFSGNDLTGIPKTVTNLGIDLINKKGVYANLNFQMVSKIPANDANTVYGESYELLHGKIGYKNMLGKHIFYNFFFGANNILNTEYASQLQINARGFGGNAPRYFYPGLPFNIYGGININYKF